MSQPPVAVAIEWLEPAQLFLVLDAANEHVFWLDAGADASAGWSWVGIGTPEAHPEVVRRVMLARAPADDTWRAGPFRGGWVGWAGYEGAAERAGAHGARADLGVADTMWLRAERWFAFDHAARAAWAVGVEAEVVDFARTTTDVAHLVDSRIAPPTRTAPQLTATARHTPREYAVLIERCRESIREGDAYQLCLTTRFEVSASVVPSLVYRRLRESSRSHHGALIRTGAVALASASPERFLEADGSRVRTRPIKGTRPRGTDAATDAALAAELVASEKERAENVMIVDLMRNDLSRVCDAGSVFVDALLEVESYPAVHQLVSVVSGSASEGTTVGDLLDAAFPAGSMTGAPKLSAMELLHALEGGTRGLFAGCFGWIGDDGRLDLAMVIRSVVIHPGGAYVGAGGGITWLSRSADEVAEVAIKAHAPLAALGAGLPPGW